MKPKSSGLPNDDDDEVVSFGEATMIRPRSVLDDAFDARTVVQIGNKNQFGQNLDPAMGQRFGEETPVPPVQPKTAAPPVPTPAPEERSAFPEPPPNIEVKRTVPQAPPMDTNSMANAVTGKKLRKDLSAGTNTNFPIPKLDNPSTEPTSEMKMEIKPEMKRVAPAPAPAPVAAPAATAMPSAPSPMMNQIPAPIVHKAAPAAKREPKPAPPIEAKLEPKIEPKIETKAEAKAERKAEVKAMHVEHNDDKRADKDDPFADIPNDIHLEPQRRAFPKKIVAAAVTLLVVVAYFVFGSSSPTPVKPGSSKELASEEAPAHSTKAKAQSVSQQSVQQEQEQASESQANVPVANVSGGAQAVLTQFGESFNKTQGRTRSDTKAD